MSQLYQIDQATDPFTIIPIGGANSFQINNLGFRRSDGLALRLPPERAARSW